MEYGLTGRSENFISDHLQKNEMRNKKKASVKTEAKDMNYAN